MKQLLKKKLREFLLNEDNLSKFPSDKYPSNKFMYHCSDDFRLEFNTDNIKGGARGNYGWGIYFASTPYKALDYGNFMTIVDKSNLNLLSLRDKIPEGFVESVESIKSFYKTYKAIIKDIMENNKYNELKEYNFGSYKGILRLLNILNKELSEAKNNRDYDYYYNHISMIDELLKKHPIDSKDKNEQIISVFRKHIDKTFYDILIYIFWQNIITDKDFSLFMKELGYDGFNYEDYEYVIFNPEKLKIVAHIEKKDGKYIER
jgi:hypothetical protein